MKRTSGNKPSQSSGEGIPGRERSVYRGSKLGMTAAGLGIAGGQGCLEAGVGRVQGHLPAHTGQ